MTAIRTILCPVDFSEATARQIGLAADLCRLFGARLVLHHNVDAAPPAVGVGWMWAHDHPDRPSQSDEESQLRRLLAELPEGVAAEGKLTHGLPATSALRVREAVAADLLVLSTHGQGGADHASITGQLLDRASCAVLALHDCGVDGRCPRFDGAEGTEQSLLVPTDLPPERGGALDLAFDLARRLPLRLHLLHVLATVEKSAPPPQELVEETRARLGGLIPADLAGRAEAHVAAGDPGNEIARAAERLEAACIVMGEHTRAPFLRWFTRDTSRDVLFRANCPIWFVPGRAAA